MCCSDEELMVKVQTNDREAFRTLFLRHHDRVRRYLFHCAPDEHLAEDCAQEAFLRLWVSRRSYQPTARFTTYLFRIAHNVWLTRRKKQNREPTVSIDARPGPPLELLDESPTPEMALLRKHRSERIRQTVASLPEHYRAVLVLCHFDDLSYAEAAQVLDIPLGTVKSRMNTAVALLRERLLKIGELQ